MSDPDATLQVFGPALSTCRGAGANPADLVPAYRRVAITLGGEEVAETGLLFSVTVRDPSDPVAEDGTEQVLPGRRDGAAMLRIPAALALVLALGGQLDGLLPPDGRMQAYPAAAQTLPVLERDPTILDWPADGVVQCEAACDLRVPDEAEGELWVSWDGTRSHGFVAGLDGQGGIPGFDAVRVGAVAGGETLRLWGEGEALIAVLPRVADVPNLVALPPSHLGAPLPQGGGPCLLDETGRGFVQCLRFTTGVANTGDVPLDLSSDLRDGRVAMTQSLPGEDHEAGLASYHASHGHFHYARFMAFDLHAVEVSGLRGEAVLTQPKTGFCMVDWGSLADAEELPAKTFWRDGCEAHQRDLEMGVNPGWYDIYRWFLPEQAIDIAGLPDGTYELVVTVDPDGTLVEAHTLDNRAATRFTLQDGQATVLEQHGLYRI